MNRILMFAILVLISGMYGSANELPPEYAPFKKLIGTWKGDSTLVISSAEGDKKVVFEHTSEYKYDNERKAITGVDTDIDPKSGITMVFHSETRWDKPSSSFKAFVWLTGHMANFYSIKYKDRVFYYDKVEKVEGTQFTAQISIDKNGDLIQKGKQITSGPNGQTTTWNNKYLKEKS